MKREVEIKLRVPDSAAARKMLRKAGFRVTKRRFHESDVVYDTPDGELRDSSRLLRIRQEGASSWVLTYKGPPKPGRHKSREEIEVGLSDGKIFATVLERLGMKPSFRYEKYRTILRQPGGAGLAMVDETPIGDFLELEGEPGWIDRMAAELGFARSDYITASYARLFFEQCGSNAGDMVFGDRRG
jgi:adenylate cyclase class 2